jgi:hypothetical protein
MICTYCRRELDDDGSHTYHATAGWETIDGTTDLRWIARNVFACRPCVEEHFVDTRAPAGGVPEPLDELLGDDDGVV